MRRLANLLFVFSSASSVACGAAATPHQDRVQSAYAPSSSSSLSSTSTASMPLHDAPAPAPRRAGASPPAAMVVRPDALEVDVALRTTVDDPDLGVRVLRDAVKALEAQLAEIAPKGSPRIRMRATTMERAPHAKRKVVASTEAPRPGEARDPFSLTAAGRIVVTLSPEQDYWERSQLLARMSTLTERAASSEGAESLKCAVSFGRIEPHVRAPQAARADLAQRWATLRKQAAREVQAGEAPLARDVCTPAQEVVERIVSLEEIELTLPIECRAVSSP